MKLKISLGRIGPDTQKVPHGFIPYSYGLRKILNQEGTVGKGSKVSRSDVYRSVNFSKG